MTEDQALQLTNQIKELNQRMIEAEKTKKIGWVIAGVFLFIKLIGK